MFGDQAVVAEATNLFEAAEIVSDNPTLRTCEDFRDLYMPFDPLLFFADAGNGDQ